MNEHLCYLDASAHLSACLAPNLAWQSPKAQEVLALLGRSVTAQEARSVKIQSNLATVCMLQARMLEGVNPTPAHIRITLTTHSP